MILCNIIKILLKIKIHIVVKNRREYFFPVPMSHLILIHVDRTNVYSCLLYFNFNEQGL